MKANFSCGPRTRSGFVMGVWVILLFILPLPLAFAAPFERVSQPTLKPGAPIPAPKSKVVLTITGATARANRGDKLAFDRPTLEKLGLISYKNSNRWYKDPVTYVGVLGSTLLKVIGIPKNATKLKLRAVNDYIIDIPLEDFERWPVMFALKLNGDYLTLRDKGPIWVVYPTHLDEALSGPEHSGKWIWQLKSMIVE